MPPVTGTHGDAGISVTRASVPEAKGNSRETLLAKDALGPI